MILWGNTPHAEERTVPQEYNFIITLDYIEQLPWYITQKNADTLSKKRVVMLSSSLLQITPFYF